jgi:hypothetical protein
MGLDCHISIKKISLSIMPMSTICVIFVSMIFMTVLFYIASKNGIDDKIYRSRLYHFIAVDVTSDFW